MVICGIVLRKENLQNLRFEGVKDSKEIKPEKRKDLAKILSQKAEDIKITEISPEKIDKLRKNGTNLNQIEEIGFAEILSQLNCPTAFIDAASANSKKFAEQLRKRLNKNMELVVEHKADENHLPVSSASIIAKVNRDERIEKLKEKYGETGSGYPSDSRTIKFLKKWIENNPEYPSFVRGT